MRYIRVITRVSKDNIWDIKEVPIIHTKAQKFGVALQWAIDEAIANLQYYEGLTVELALAPEE